PALLAFSFITVSFQIFFAWWIFARLGVDADDFFKATMALALIGIFFPSAVRPAAAPWIAAGVFLVSCLCIVQTHRHGSLTPLATWFHELRNVPPRGAIFMIPVSVFGFLLCPYLDLTFHRARQQLDARQA